MTMSILVEATAAELAEAEGAIGPLPGFRHLRSPEAGLVMLRGRVGGAGASFNIGEATVTRCLVVTEAGTEGAAYHLGRDLARAEKAALFEALSRDADWRDKVEAALLAPVRERLAGEREAAAEKTAATRVEFFTMVRGEDQR
ncbi:alpha-D-ribose 1-methylphosphonate 5-triphosphate synthase subunit PhnG [Rhizobiales bacterium GAS113]|jgi:alpha-D-ribose 1-methylphosphonate 5-triphosphate synthase subunit PhnG|nr:alpha-D-ribose 1-methylphosphonate 5-triphosphate synthase subunit PhnG [Rhizobiales bacterium GAS113]